MSRVRCRRRCAQVLALAAAVVGTSLAAADLEERGKTIEATTLANGLRVIVWPDHDVPSVTLNLWYRVGSRNERPGATGLAHFFEHMMFNGTATRAPGEFDRIMEAGGGSNNAYTTSDVTVYMDWFPKSALDLVLELEADRMRALAFDPKVVESERGVVYSERRLRVDNDNFNALLEQVQSSAFLAHPYQIPTIGWPSDIRGWKMTDLQHFYETYYAPNNAVMVIVGDVDPRNAFAQVERHFAGIAPSPLPAPPATVEPEQQGERRIVLKRPGQTAVLQAAYQGLAAADAAMPALELLATILGRGESSRLHRQLVEEARIAVDTGSYIQKGFDPGLAWFYATLVPGADPARAEGLLNLALEQIAREGVGEAELQKARNAQLAGFWRSMAEIDGKAQALGRYEVFHGDYRKLFAAPMSYEQVSAAQVQALARRLLDPDHRTLGVLLPVAETTAAEGE